MSSLTADFVSTMPNTPLKPAGSKLIDVLLHIEKRHANPNELSGLRTGFYDFDCITEGLRKSELIVVASRPCVGKSTFCSNIAEHVAMVQNLPVAVFTPVDSAERYISRLLCAIAWIDANRLRTGQLRENDIGRINQAADRISNSSLYIDDSSMLTVSAIRQKCLELKAKHDDLALVIVDDVSYVLPDANMPTGAESASYIHKYLKLLSRELGCPVIIVSQVDRSVEARKNKRPRLLDLQESGFFNSSHSLCLLDSCAFFARHHCQTPYITETRQL